MSVAEQERSVEQYQFPVMHTEARTVLGCLLDNWAHRLNQGVDAAELNLEIHAVLSHVLKIMGVFSDMLPSSEPLVSCQICIPAFNIPSFDAEPSDSPELFPVYQNAVQVFIQTWHDDLSSGRDARAILNEIRAVATYLSFTQELFQLHLTGKEPAAVLRIGSGKPRPNISADIAPWLAQCEVEELIKLSLAGWAGSLDVLMGNTLTASVTDIENGAPVMVVDAEDARAWLATNRPSAWYALLRAELDMEMNATQLQLVTEPRAA